MAGFCDSLSYLLSKRESVVVRGTEREEMEGDRHERRRKRAHR